MASINNQSSREVVLAVGKDFGLALEDASKDLKNDREIILAALKTDKY